METSREIDPNGDVILCLHNPGAPFARRISEPEEIQFRVSSRHLMLASPYFKKALDGPWEESAPDTADHHLYISAEDWDPQAFLILMHIIHGRNGQVPRSVSLELLAKIAVLVDYYECYEAVEVFAEIWLRQLKDQVPKKINRELILWLCVSWIFSATDIFTAVTKTALEQARGPLPTLYLPIPPAIVETIESRRQETVDKIYTVLSELYVFFRDGPDPCHFECSAIRLGALIKEIRPKRLDPRPKLPLLGYCIHKTKKAACSILSPPTRDPHNISTASGGRKTYGSYTVCGLQSAVGGKMQVLDLAGMPGMELSHFNGRRSPRGLKLQVDIG
ncbi:hypothetical protein N656DRAFT_712408 [Canariomyces notabilis]|uniref:BTB domain-containing protein n=1 Tax=Canariomyces notabilis TaxID=2074819 RepID=A0AAN6TB37_9PEZI|nr:hypothetical protein N656DRAFT_712408 [Canariomyces arenarius]